MAPDARMLFSRAAADDYKALSPEERASVDRKIRQLYDRMGTSLVAQSRGKRTSTIGAGGPLRVVFARSGRDTIVLAIEKRPLRLRIDRQNSKQTSPTEAEELLFKEEEAVLNRIEAAQARGTILLRILFGAIYISVPFALLSVFHYAIVVPITAAAYGVALLLGLVREPLQRWRRH